jgi:UDP-3-O-acyl N-acetylglucosamine deacetylase
MLGYRDQRTLARPALLEGVGMCSGAAVRLRFEPAAPHTGLAFVRTDVSGSEMIPAVVGSVTGTNRRTTLGRPPRHVALVEHVLAALAGLRVDNCLIHLDAAEPPGCDGSARQFVRALLKVGIVRQAASRAVWTVSRPVTLARAGATLTVHPGEEDLKISYMLDYGARMPIGRQTHSQRITPERFTHSLADCRTFILEEEAAEFRRQGLGERMTPADLLVFGPRGPIQNRLRHADEPVRHKILDLVGDLALVGQDLRGHVVGYRSGHPLNVEMAGELCRMMAGRPGDRHAA